MFFICIKYVYRALYSCFSFALSMSTGHYIHVFHLHQVCIQGTVLMFFICIKYVYKALYACFSFALSMDTGHCTHVFHLH